jgi:hydrogenase maturation protease
MRILALGSPHGDDRVGWEVVERLRQEQVPGIALAALHEPIGLFDHLGDCEALLLIDACRSGAPPGTIIRMDWPGSILKGQKGISTHGFGLASALALAQALGRLPPRVVLIGAEVQTCDPGAEISAPVRRALPELYRQVLAEIKRLQRERAPRAEGTVA